MLDAAVATEAFDASISDNSLIVGLEFTNYPSRVWASKWYELFPSTDARNTLTWKGRFSGMANVYNFYSSTEDVLAGADGTIDSLFNAQNAWTNQEMMKGRLAMGWAPGNREGGWDFNTYYDTNIVNYIEYDEMGNPTTNWHNITLPPEDSANISSNSLKEHSFFYRFDNEDDICGTNGSEFVSDRTVHCRLLADGIPALSNPAGGSSLQNSQIPSIDMDGFKKQGYWPDSKNKWRHSHIREVAYPFNSGVFDEIVDVGGLE